jgi:hypothetical protein
MEQRRAHWWNGKWGRIARRDLYVNEDDRSGVWFVIARDGGADGQERRWTFYCEQDAIALAERLMEDPDPIDDWRRLPIG